MTDTAGASGAPNRKAPAASAAGLPRIEADLVLMHAPAVFDFRDRRDIHFPFLGTSGDVPITPLYEYFPVGFKTLQRSLGEAGHRVEVLNLSSVFLRYPALDLATVAEAFDVRFVGIDLHWMVHVQGSLAVAEALKELRPDIRTVFGGISSTYYADELIAYPFIDMVMRGYDTHEPVAQLLGTPDGDYSGVANLLWKDVAGAVRDNAFTHKPDSFACGIDWSVQPERPDAATAPILELLSTQNAGCAYNCPWCGGSREAFRRIFGRRKAMARKPAEEVAYELATMNRLEGIEKYHFYSVGSYNETREGMDAFLEGVSGTDLRSVSYEQYHLTPEPVLRKMVEANAHTIITLSPESHDPRVARLAGRGVYTNQEMEDWLESALEIGIQQVDIWYFVGMPEQDAASVAGTVEYCEHLLRKFTGKRINPMICPMIPFLDPASSIFEDPEKYGYTVFYRTAEAHRRGMEHASIINRINYETKWLSRSDLVHVGFRAVASLMEAKAEHGFLPRGLVREYVRRIEDELEFIDEVHAADSLEDPVARAAALDALGDQIRERNDRILFSGVANQAFPINRQIGGRWFDEMGWTGDELRAAAGAASPD